MAWSAISLITKSAALQITLIGVMILPGSPAGFGQSDSARGSWQACDGFSR